MNDQPTVVKADGNSEPFAREKLMRSLRRSGTGEEMVRDIVSHIEVELSDGMTTEDIYRHARSLLKRTEKVAAAKYSLRRALFSLGPTGFPFEDFLGQLFETRGYSTKTGVLIRGACVLHEVDLVAHKGDHCFIAEAKFHARPGVKSDLQVALYSHARFKDLEGKHFPGIQDCPITEGYIITNTKFTKAAIEYANCVGLTLISWDHPHEKTLQDYIEEAGIYPITALPSLSVREKQILLENGIILCRDMHAKRDVLRSIGIAPRKIETMIEESVNLCKS